MEAYRNDIHTLKRGVQMMKSKPIAGLLLLGLSLVLIVSGCSSGVAKETQPQNAEGGKKTSEVFELYDKIQLGMTKAEVDSTLGVPAVADTGAYAVKGIFSYQKPDSSYGVSAAFNEKDILYSKTVIYSSHADIAPLTAKPVNEGQSEKITEGMDVKAVSEILGGPGVICSTTGSMEDGSNPGTIQRWANKDGSCIQVVFGSDGKAGNILFFEQ